MQLDELKSILKAHPETFPRFILPDGGCVPAHYHLTEVGYVVKHFIDCGGTTRKSESCVLQLWANVSDKDHRIHSGKLASILDLGSRVLPHGGLEVEVEYDDWAVSQFPIVSASISDGYLDFTLSTKHTACLARESCGIDESEFAPAASACC